MSGRALGFGLALIGASVAIVSLAADSLGLSGTGSDGFGNRQIVGLVIGLALVAAGAVVVARRRSGSGS